MLKQSVKYSDANVAIMTTGCEHLLKRYSVFHLFVTKKEIVLYQMLVWR